MLSLLKKKKRERTMNGIVRMLTEEKRKEKENSMVGMYKKTKDEEENECTYYRSNARLRVSACLVREKKTGRNDE